VGYNINWEKLTFHLSIGRQEVGERIEEEGGRRELGGRR